MSQLKVVRKDSSLNKGVHCECQKQIIDGKRLLLCLLCVVSVAFSLEARQRTEAEALRIARSFMRDRVCYARPRDPIFGWCIRERGAACVPCRPIRITISIM